MLQTKVEYDQQEIISKSIQFENATKLKSSRIGTELVYHSLSVFTIYYGMDHAEAFDWITRLSVDESY